MPPCSNSNPVISSPLWWSVPLSVGGTVQARCPELTHLTPHYHVKDPALGFTMWPICPDEVIVPLTFSYLPEDNTTHTGSIAMVSVFLTIDGAREWRRKESWVVSLSASRLEFHSFWRKVFAFRGRQAALCVAVRENGDSGRQCVVVCSRYSTERQTERLRSFPCQRSTSWP